MNIENDINLLIDWADKSMCYSWLHNNAYHNLSFKDKLYTIPVILLTTIAGTSQFANQVISNDLQQYISMAFGSLTIFSGFLTALKKFLNITELSEAHKISKMNWEKLYREIKIELTRLDNRENSCKINVTNDISNLEELTTKFKNQFNHLMETSPVIPLKTINSFNKEFNKEKYKDIKKPEICGNLHHTGFFYRSIQ